MVSWHTRLIVSTFIFLLAPMAVDAAQVTPTPKPASEVDAAGTREDPYPLNTAVPLSDDWIIVVVDVTPDATQEILAENQFNDPPEPGVTSLEVCK